MKKKKLKLWQKLAIWFASIHFLLSVIILFLAEVLKSDFSFFYITLNLATMPMAISMFFENILSFNVFIYLFFLTIPNSIIFGIIGALIGLLIKAFSSKKKIKAE